MTPQFGQKFDLVRLEFPREMELINQLVATSRAFPKPWSVATQFEAIGLDSTYLLLQMQTYSVR